MSNVGVGNDGTGKTKWWVSGIVAPVLAGLLIWYLTGNNSPFHHPNPTPTPSPTTSTSQSWGRVEVPQGYGSLYVHTAPSLSASTVAALAGGAAVQIQCTTQGEAVGGSSLWDWIGTGYVPDAYIYTGTNQPTMPSC